MHVRLYRDGSPIDTLNSREAFDAYMEAAQQPEGVISLRELREVTGLEIAPGEPGHTTVYCEE